MRHTIYLQLFAEGGSTGDGSSGAEGSAVKGVAPRGGDGLSNVVYGKSSGEITNPKGKAADSPETMEARFEELIKGEYKEAFSKRTQAIIDERFKKAKGTEERLKSIEPILSVLAEKYGSDANDIEALKKAIDEDDTFYQEAAMEAGLTVKQYKEYKAMERQNAELLAEKQRADEQKETTRILADWDRQGKEFAEKYGIEGFDFGKEIQNPQFANLLKTGVTVEGAYKAIHFDEMVGGAMAHTASKVKEGLVNSINGRAKRPAEGATTSQTATIFKTDVHQLTAADRREIAKRAIRGEQISF